MEIDTLQIELIAHHNTKHLEIHPANKWKKKLDHKTERRFGKSNSWFLVDTVKTGNGKDKYLRYLMKGKMKIKAEAN